MITRPCVLSIFTNASFLPVALSQTPSYTQSVSSRRPQPNAILYPELWMQELVSESLASLPNPRPMKQQY